MLHSRTDGGQTGCPDGPGAGVLRGFTLIEVLIALGLSVVLISAVYGAVEMYYRFQTAGRAEIRGQQLLRSLTRLIARDLASVVQAPPEPATASSSTGQAADSVDSSSGSSTGSSTSSSSSSSSSSGSTSSTFSGSSFDSMAKGGTSSTTTTSGTATSFLGLEEAGRPVIFGLAGTEQLLHLTVSLPTREMNYISLSSAAIPEDRSGDLQIITFGLAPIDAMSMTILQKNLKTSRPSVGLGRRVRDLFSPFGTDESLESQHLLAPEVTELGFRYFDSGEWFSTWDSVTMGRLPRAVEIDFGFWTPPNPTVGGKKLLGDGSVTHVQYVFKVPLSFPTVE